MNVKADTELSVAKDVVDQISNVVADELAAEVASQVLQKEQDQQELKIKQFQLASKKKILQRCFKVCLIIDIQKSSS